MQRHPLTFRWWTKIEPWGQQGALLAFSDGAKPPEIVAWFLIQWVDHRH